MVAFSTASSNVTLPVSMEAARTRLTAHFRPHNERLAALLGDDPGWEHR